MKSINYSLLVATFLLLNLSACSMPVTVVNDEKEPIPIHSHLGVKLNNIVMLGGVDCPGVNDEAILKAGGSSDNYSVPEDKNLVITDISISPQNLNVTGLYGFQILPDLPFTTSLISVASTEDWSSFRIHFTSGMQFNPGSHVRFLLNTGPACAEINVFGYLAEL